MRVVRTLFTDIRLGAMFAIMAVGAVAAVIGGRWGLAAFCALGVGVSVWLAGWRQQQSTARERRNDSWALLEAARPLLLERFLEDGVRRIEFEAAYPFGDAVAVWLCTTTDEQKTALGGPQPRRAVVFEILVSVGFDPKHLGGMATAAQSQETVDREYRGRWSKALR